MDFFNPFFVSTFSDSIVSEKCGNIIAIEKYLKDENADCSKEIENIVSGMSLTELLSSINKALQYIGSAKFINIFSFLKSAKSRLSNYCSSDKFIEHTKDCGYSLKSLTKEILEKYENNIPDEYSLEFSECIEKSFEISYVAINGGDYNIKHVTNESQTIIKSIGNYTQTINFPQLTKVIKTPEEISELIYSNSDEDYLIVNIENIHKYLESVIDNLTVYADDFIKLIDYMYEHLFNNITALEKIKDELDICISIIDGKDVIDENEKNSLNLVYEIVNNKISSITNLIEKKEITGDYTSSPMVEMGLGMVEYILNNGDLNDPETVMVLNNECANINYMQLNESLLASVINDKEKKRLKKEQAKQDKEEERKERKENAARQKEEFKRRSKEAEFERKEKDKQDKYELKKANKELGLGKDKFTTFRTTNLTGFKAWKTAKRALGAVAAGAISTAAGLGPIGAGLYLVKKAIEDKRFPSKDKLALMTDIKKELISIEEKKQVAERAGNTKAKIELGKMEQKLRDTYASLGVTLGRGDDI